MQPMKRMAGHEILSIGMDVGTTTSQIVLSALRVSEDPSVMKKKYIISQRKVCYESDIFFTPFDGERIDLPTLENRFDMEIKKAGVNQQDVESGAIILTGVAAQAPNAREVLSRLNSGKKWFISAIVGPKFESLLAAKGAGTVELSKRTGKTILHVDIGGGTSNLAIVSKGKVLSTACIFIGGRLVQKKYGVTLSVHPAIKRLADSAGIKLSQGAPLSSDTEIKLCRVMTESLLEVMVHGRLSERTAQLMNTEPLSYNGEIDSVRFSGGVSEYIYGHSAMDYGDIGPTLGRIIREEAGSRFRIEPPGETIRATVIGAGGYTLQLSGTTTLIDADLLPMKDIIVLPVEWRECSSRMLRRHVADGVKQAVSILDKVESERRFALYFNSIPRSYDDLRSVAQGIVDTLGDIPLLILVCNEDVGRSLGNMLKREAGFTGRVISIDEVEMEGGEFLDLGKVMNGTDVVPVTVKTLAFK